VLSWKFRLELAEIRQAWASTKCHHSQDNVSLPLSPGYKVNEDITGLLSDSWQPRTDKECNGEQQLKTL
jgi:hypothetical protein